VACRFNIACHSLKSLISFDDLVDARVREFNPRYAEEPCSGSSAIPTPTLTVTGASVSSKK
jgi:hypothetical protein